MRYLTNPPASFIPPRIPLSRSTSTTLRPVPSPCRSLAILPEVNPDNLRVAVEDNGLVICGERPNPWQGERKLLRVERPHGYFVRRFALPDDANTRELNTNFAESVLEVRVRKVSSPKRTPAPTNAPPRLKLRSAA